MPAPQEIVLVVFFRTEYAVSPLVGWLPQQVRGHLGPAALSLGSPFPSLVSHALAPRRYTPRFPDTGWAGRPPSHTPPGGVPLRLRESAQPPPAVMGLEPKASRVIFQVPSSAARSSAPRSSLTWAGRGGSGHAQHNRSVHCPQRPMSQGWAGGVGWLDTCLDGGPASPHGALSH